MSDITMGVVIIAILIITRLVIALGYAYAQSAKCTQVTHSQWRWLKLQIVWCLIAKASFGALLVWEVFIHHSKLWVIIVTSVLVFIFSILSYVHVYCLGIDKTRLVEDK